MSEDRNFKVDFIGIGAPRCATTWIYECLKEHPQICGANKKEVSFFNKERKYNHGIDFYKKFFTECSNDKLRGEFTPSYYSHSKVAARIHRHFPNTKIIASLRDPVERALSAYRFGRFAKTRTGMYKSFEEALQKSPTLKDNGFYFKHLKSFYDIFSRDKIFIGIFEELKQNPTSTIQKIYKFLGVEANFSPPSATSKISTTGSRGNRVKIPWLLNALHKLTDKIRKNQQLYALLDNSVLGTIHEKLVAWNKEPEKINQSHPTTTDKIKPKTKQELREFYKKDIEKLEQLIGRDLTSWKKNSEK